MHEVAFLEVSEHSRTFVACLVLMISGPPTNPYTGENLTYTGYVPISVTKRRLMASDCQEGNRRDCSMSGNQTSGKGGGVQCVMRVVCMYVCMLDIIYI